MTDDATARRGAGESGGESSGDAALAWVVAHLARVPAGGAVLDVACGRGRHLRVALTLGLTVVAVDRDLVGVGDLAGVRGVELIAADLEGGGAWPLGGRRFDAVVVTNFLHRPLFPDLIAAVADGGLLICETFQAGNERLGRPRNPDFLLQAGELARAVAGRLDVVGYEEAVIGWPPRAVKQRLAARRPASG